MSEEVHRQYIEQKINPILEELVTQMLIHKPADPATYMLESLLLKTGKKEEISSAERAELASLRQELARLKQTSVATLEESGGSE